MVKMIKPSSLTQAFEVALLEETTISALNKTNKPNKFNPNFKSPYDHHKTSEPSNTIPRKTQPFLYKTITPTDIRTKKCLRLYFRCDGKYTLGHIYKNMMLKYMVVDEEDKEEERMLRNQKRKGQMRRNREKSCRFSGCIDGEYEA
ncbi:Uncharacterized protein Adt_22136 [Abeliophyllum distichum]|uniref:Uncharacterized protein n=1 Tax=Abeliophyllum distichum TaxID=126358 RepID=A0ABD1T1C2_9LAMI